ncbi:glycosyltransferase [Cetobacterium sp. 2A]|uniref:glycosyltransferase n=1 Tax=Cetobacterium sp. 2A TaxID=2754723 RepID=UPI00163C23E3|nr:glycosyltransferase [Cetobacterium sp. 2A]MBC2856165.1 glycosyltransferase [Cetobacterium sp. 2A]
MKKVLYISSSDPDLNNGGSIGTKKFLETFKKLEIEKKIQLFTIVSKNTTLSEKKYNLEIGRNKFKALLSRVLGYSDQLELYKKDIVNLIKTEEIEIVIIQSSRLGNISEEIRKKIGKKIQIIQNFDNFEYEFSKMYTKNMNKLIKIIELKNITNSERKSLENSDKTIFLTKKDFESTKDFYNLEKPNAIIPIFYENNFKNIAEIKKKKSIIFTGTLDMEANIEAALFLIENYETLKNDIGISEIVIAGRNPNARIYEAIKLKSAEDFIKVYSNPTHEEMSNLLLKSTLYVSPVFIGSGMKTKFLEAISFGLPIIASDHTMIGYDWINFNNYNFIEIFSDYSKEDMVEKIKLVLKEYENYSLGDFNKIQEFYKINFSKEKIIKQVEDIILS